MAVSAANWQVASVANLDRKTPPFCRAILGAAAPHVNAYTRSRGVGPFIGLP
jgi:hypothetical protein